jgi:Family of unknown function (DUF5677)
MFPNVDAVEVSNECMQSFSGEADFNAVGVELLKEACSYLTIACNIYPLSKDWNKTQAVVGGSGIRVFKLVSAYLDQTCQNRREISEILSRLIFETAVTIRYFIAHQEPETAESFIRYALRFERELWDEIQINIERRNGVIIPIEDRMLQSITRASERSGYSIEDIDLKDRSNWAGKNLYQKSKEVGWDKLYLASFGGMSNAVHGSWTDLYGHHLLATDNATYTGVFDWSVPRPQSILAIVRLITQISADLFHFFGGDAVYEHFEPMIISISERTTILTNGHERYLSTKNWPEI